MDDTPLKKLIATLCDTEGETEVEIRAELAEQGIDLDASKTRFEAQLDLMLAARIVRLKKEASNA